MSTQENISLEKQIQWLEKHIESTSDAIRSDSSDGSILLDLIVEEANFKAILESLKQLSLQS